jgi:hypothetical protein
MESSMPHITFGPPAAGFLNLTELNISAHPNGSLFTDRDGDTFMLVRQADGCNAMLLRVDESRGEIYHNPGVSWPVTLSAQRSVTITNA